MIEYNHYNNHNRQLMFQNNFLSSTGFLGLLNSSQQQNGDTHWVIKNSRTGVKNDKLKWTITYLFL